MDNVVAEIILSDTEKLVVRYDDDYQIDQEMRELTDEQVQEEIELIEREGIYGVELHTLKTWARENEKGVIVEKKTEWDYEDSIWGCFLDAEYTAKTVASEYFTLSDRAEEECSK